MTKTQTPSGFVFVLDKDDIDSAIRQFICTCNPEVAKDYSISKEMVCDYVSVPTLYTAIGGPVVDELISEVAQAVTNNQQPKS